ncbi:hypothetical protein JY651_18575 [Pyxidicoccus parkwayensis]|uniref:Lipoprotein n=1 Tax=Pyxidicoccus parkwayensis TaxID=2813578 RepID=A0ABX7P8L6_9BACT|nr:hypothetical protein [Pyxidicoccus parkwaysis]QSQ26795.1 hypothetical protein JY651_18575 [Pyxidicoccus parkwaysis]
MKRSLVATVAFFSFSLLACGGANTGVESEATPADGQESTVSQFETCTGYKACSSIANTFCSPEGATTHCCASNGTTSDLICARTSTSSAARWLYY